MKVVAGKELKMRTDLPARIDAAARAAARMDYRLSQLQSLVACAVVTNGAANQRLRLAQLRRDLAVARLERLRNEFYLTLIGSARAASREAA